MQSPRRAASAEAFAGASRALAQKFELEEVRTALLAMSAVLLLIGLYYVGSYPRA